MKSANNPFDNSAQNYLLSTDHARGDDLKIVREYFSHKKFHKLLDVATGVGHFTGVFNADEKYAVDLSFNMLNISKKNFPIKLACIAEATCLPFKTGSFDVVTCRIAMHHFQKPDLFFKEVYRILVHKGYFVLIDSIVDVDDAYLNVIEFVRDNSHIRSMTVKEIINLSYELFRLEFFFNIYKEHNFIEWATRLGADENKVMVIKDKFLALPEHVKDELLLKIENNNIKSYTDKKGLFIFTKI
ncbi:MAG: class I SAM-dependent methyltransferase [Calditerrivibrio sp.]|nr:class I SAM-dependent methyltransferase [Calditerrivibrio sp.]